MESESKIALSERLRHRNIAMSDIPHRNIVQNSADSQQHERNQKRYYFYKLFHRNSGRNIHITNIHIS